MVRFLKESNPSTKELQGQTKIRLWCCTAPPPTPINSVYYDQILIVGDFSSEVVVNFGRWLIKGILQLNKYQLSSEMREGRNCRVAVEPPAASILTKSVSQSVSPSVSYCRVNSSGVKSTCCLFSPNKTIWWLFKHKNHNSTTEQIYSKASFPQHPWHSFESFEGSCCGFSIQFIVIRIILLTDLLLFLGRYSFVYCVYCLLLRFWCFI